LCVVPPAGSVRHQRDLPDLRSASNAALIARSQSGVMAAIGDDAQIDSSRAVTTQASRPEWDELVASLGGQPFQSWAWGELKSHFGWRPYRVTAGSGRATAQLLIRPYRGLAVAYVPRGPVFSGETSVDEQLVKDIIQVARSQRAAFLRVEPDVLEGDSGADSLRSSLGKLGFRTSDRTLQPHSTIRLDLTPAEDQLMAAFSKGHRADIRRAERDGVVIRVGTPEADADVLHQMLVATNTRKSFGFHSASYYRQLLRDFGDAARIQVAELDGKPIGASLVLAFGRHGTYLAAGSNAAGLEHRAAHLLQWHAIRWARERGALTWDLWGIADARGRYELASAQKSMKDTDLATLEAAARSDPLDGVYRFKKGWGGEVVRTVPAFDRVFIAPAYWYWQWRRGEA
jgi:lipid II:glycine glycyltransferase (peptidoglycan interpeptide bridge formation enzyme)